VPIDTNTPAGQWFVRLMTRLGNEAPRYDLLDNYYRGRQVLPWSGKISGAESAAFAEFQRKSRTNFAALVVEAPRERMEPVGFRTGAVADQTGDAEAWRIWQANGMDAVAPQMFRASMSMSMGYMMVGGVDSSIGAPLITAEDPRQCITWPNPANPRQQLAGLKVWADDIMSADLAHLYIRLNDNSAVMLRAKRNSRTTGTQVTDISGWEWMDEGQMIPAVPLVPFPNRLDLTGRTMGEFEDVLDVLDRINLTVFQRLWIAALQSHRQRAVEGAPMHDEAGNEIDYGSIFSSDPGAMWQLPPGAKLWESGNTDVGPLLTAVRHDVQDLAAITRTPLFYLTPDAANGSAEGASLAREGLVFKTKDRIAGASDPLEDVMSLAFLFAGDTARASRKDMQVIWAPPERFSLAERYDAAVKGQAAGLPFTTIAEEVLQLSPQQIQRVEAERVTAALLAPPV
jgi:hypothetical protein